MADRTVTFHFMDGTTTTIYDASSALDCDAPEFVSGTTYNQNAFVWYNYKLYRCDKTSTTVAPGVSGSGWTQVELANTIADSTAPSGTTSGKKGLTILTDTYSNGTSTTLALSQKGAKGLYDEAVRKGTSSQYGQVKTSDTYTTSSDDASEVLTRKGAYNLYQAAIVNMWDNVCDKIATNVSIVTDSKGKIFIRAKNTSGTNKDSTAGYLSSLGTSDMSDNLVYTDATGNFYAHTLTLT